MSVPPSYVIVSDPDRCTIGVCALYVCGNSTIIDSFTDTLSASGNVYVLLSFSRCVADAANAPPPVCGVTLYNDNNDDDEPPTIPNTSQPDVTSTYCSQKWTLPSDTVKSSAIESILCPFLAIVKLSVDKSPLLSINSITSPAVAEAGNVTVYAPPDTSIASLSLATAVYAPVINVNDIDGEGKLVSSDPSPVKDVATISPVTVRSSVIVVFVADKS